MAFADFPDQRQSVELLQRSLERGRLGHAYLFIGHQLTELEALARTLAKTLNCLNPVRRARPLTPALSPEGGEGVRSPDEVSPAVDCCDQCAVCKKIDAGNHGDVHWVRPESKSRTIVVDQMRELMHEINLKPNDAEYKVAVIEAADRMNTQAANAFLKTLEEPPAKSILILLTTEPQRLLETILSRCLRLNFGGEGTQLSPARMDWLAEFAEQASAEHKSLLSRYRLLGALLKQLGALREEIDASLTARSPLQRYDDVDPKLREKWEEELLAAIEAEYRLQRADLLASVQWWLRDVWVQTLAGAGRGARSAEPGKKDSELLSFPKLTSTGRVAKRLSPEQAVKNLEVMERTQRLLGSNVQEALALEVGLLKLNL